MATGTYAPSSIKAQYAENYCGVPAPSPTECRGCFVAPGSGVSGTSTLAQLIAAEIIPTTANGYSRKVIGNPISGVASSVLTSTAHGNANGTTGYLVAASSGSLPGGYTANTEVYVINSSANTFQISLTSGGSAITLSSAGSNVVFLPSGSYNATNKRLEVPINIVLTANTDLISHQGYFILRGCSANASIVLSSISGNIITTPSHGLTTGDAVMVTADAGATQPGGVSATTIYYARAASSTTLSLHPTAADAAANTNVVTISSAGSGSIRVRYANGSIDTVTYYSAQSDINPGQSQTFVITRNSPNTGASNGV